MKKTLRRKFILFAMSAVTVLLVVLIGTINVLNWVLLDRQSDRTLHALGRGGAPFPQADPGPFGPPVNADAVQAARYFLVYTDDAGQVLAVDLKRISSVTEEEAVQYAAQIQGDTGQIDRYKYEVRALGPGRVIFFLDTSGQTGSFLTVLVMSCTIALACWLLMLLFVILLSGRVVRPVLAGMEKQKQFITNAGHELKTPLAIIQSNNDAATLIHGETKYSRNIRLQTQRLNVLMTNLLTLAKLDEEVRLPTEPVDISALLAAALPVYADALSQKQITLSTAIEPGLRLQVHRDTFAQLVSILLDNAVRYTPEGGSVSVTARSHGGHIEITEANTCQPPLPPDPERLFERFYRGDNARTQDSAASGFGIGLSAARAIAETFGGRLTAACSGEDTIAFTARF